MLPRRREALHRALAALAPLRDRGAAVRLRVSLADGSVADGYLLSASHDHISLRVPPAGARYVPAEQIRSVHRAKPRRDREWLLAGAGILGATAALVALASLPYVGPYLRHHGQEGFVVIFYLGAGLLGTLLAKTGLRDWLTRWETLVDAQDA